MIQKIKTIVCGSTFGQYYIEALRKYSELFELVGLYARGSKRSIELANRNNIILYTSINEIPKDVLLACVVIRSEGVGGDGCALAIKLMERGIHVIQEQPVYQKNIKECYKVAKKYHAIYNIGDLYIKLPSVKRFVKMAQKICSLDSLKYMSLMFCTQVAYPALAILIEAVPSFKEWKKISVKKENGPFDIITGLAGNVSMTIEFNNQINPQKPDDFMYILHKFSLFFGSGILSLEDTFGPVTWRPRIYIENYGNEEMSDCRLNEISYALLEDYEEKQINQIFEKEWIDAIGLELLEMKKQIENKKLDYKRAQKDFLVAKLWEDLYRISGYANLVEEENYTYISIDTIRKNDEIFNKE